MDHRDALRIWLRSKGFHRDDIASALEYYDNQSVKPRDKNVLHVAEESHKKSLELSARRFGGVPVLVQYRAGNPWIVGTCLSILWTTIGLRGSEIAEWLLGQTRYLSSLTGW